MFTLNNTKIHLHLLNENTFTGCNTILHIIAMSDVSQWQSSVQVIQEWFNSILEQIVQSGSSKRFDTKEWFSHESGIPNYNKYHPLFFLFYFSSTSFGCKHAKTDPLWIYDGIKGWCCIFILFYAPIFIFWKY